MGKGSVIRQKKQAGRILVQPSDRKKAAASRSSGMASTTVGLRGSRVAVSTLNYSLLEHDIDMSRRVDRLAVNGERDGFRSNFAAGSAHGVPFYGRSSAADDLRA